MPNIVIVSTVVVAIVLDLGAGIGASGGLVGRRQAQSFASTWIFKPAQGQAGEAFQELYLP